MEGERHTDLTIYRRLLTHTRPCWGSILGLFGLSLLTTPLSLAAPLPLKIAVDHAIGAQPLPGWLDRLLPATLASSPVGLLGLAAALVILVAVGNQSLTLATSLWSMATAQRLVVQFRTTLFRHVQRLSLTYHDTKGSTDSLYRIAYDAQAIQYVAIDGVIPFVSSAMSFVAMLYVTVRLDWQLALVALAVSPILFILSHSYRRLLRERYREVKRLESGALAVVQEVLGALRVVKAFGQEDREERRFVGHAEKSARAQNELALFEGRFALLTGVTTAVGTALTLLIGVGHVRAGTLTIGGLLLAMAYLAQLYSPLTTISRKVASIQSQLASLERAFTVLDEAPDVAQHENARPLVRSTGGVTFRNVSFAYADERPILNDVSFQLKPGARLGISGATGAGKTTLVNLLTRFYDPTEGAVLLDGVDLRDYRLADLRAQFAIVLQDPVLFSTTIGENIAYGRPDATEDEIADAAKAANIHDFIAALPDQYDTLVGERGMRLSGGERQRISLARAFLKDAPILVLDEPTSSVDTATETLIMEAIERLMRGRTTLMIAHRLSTLEHCDVRISVEGGRLSTVPVPSPAPDRYARSGR